MALDPSKFHIFSMGLVAENKIMSSNDILVIPHEHLPMVDGELKSNPQAMTANGVDASGKAYNVNATIDNCIECTWYNAAGDNRATSPDVRRGEKVKVWRYADTDMYYWTPMGMDNTLRKLETVRHTFSGTSDESTDSTAVGNCYYHEVSTHNGTITTQTSKQNGEVAVYTVQIDAKNGFVHVQDDAGNLFELDTKGHKLTLMNSDKSSIVIEKQNITVTCADTLTVAATKAIKISTKDLQVTAETAVVNATTSFKLNSPDIEMNGPVKTSQGLTNTGTLTNNGSITNSGSINSTGDVSAPNLH
jgi:phage baseplate assembly protein gpV